MNHVGKETAENFYGTGERDVDICDRFEFTHDGGRSLHISRRPELIQVFFLSFGAYLMCKR